MGEVAFILNYVPILGPAAAIFIFLFAGSLRIASTGKPCSRRRSISASM
jgi:hypothetical protein